MIDKHLEIKNQIIKETKVPLTLGLSRVNKRVNAKKSKIVFNKSNLALFVQNYRKPIIKIGY